MWLKIYIFTNKDIQKGTVTHHEVIDDYIKDGKIVPSRKYHGTLK